MGYAKLSRDTRESLKRKASRSVRPYRGGIVDQHLELIESFCQRDVERYEHLYRRWAHGRNVDFFLEKVQQRGISSGPIYELAKIRCQDRYVHQKILAMLRYRWTSYKEMADDRINKDNEKFWLRMAKAIINRGKANDKYASKYWQGNNGIAELIKHLKNLWHQQSGLCAESGLEMVLELKHENKCSPDRIDSSKGYDPKNIRLVCVWVNTMKLDTPQHIFEQRIKLLYESTLQKTPKVLL